jgi:hypothetical protein
VGVADDFAPVMPRYVQENSHNVGLDTRSPTE